MILPHTSSQGTVSVRWLHEIRIAPRIRSADSPMAPALRGHFAVRLAPRARGPLVHQLRLRSGSPSQDNRFGGAIAFGDFNGDGFGDLAVGVPGASSGAELRSGWAPLNGAPLKLASASELVKAGLAYDSS